MKSKLRYFWIFIIVLLLAVLVSGWIYRHRLDSLVCRIAVNYIESKSDIEINYSSIEANFAFLDAKDVEVVSDDFHLNIKTLKIDYDKAIIFSKHKLAHLNNIDLNNFTLVIAENDDEKNKQLINGDAAKKRRRIVTDILSKFHCLLNLKNGRVVFEEYGFERAIEISKASLLRRASDDALVFELLTSNNGLMPESVFRGVFEPSLPGYFDVNAMVNVFFYDNQWRWEDIDIDCDWSLDGEFVFNMVAATTNAAKIDVGYVTNIFEQDISNLEVKAKGITLSKEPRLNQIYLSDDLLDVFGQMYRKISDENHISGIFDADVSVEFQPDMSDRDIDIRVGVKDAELRYVKFPYRLEGIEGDVKFSDSNLDIKLHTTKNDVIEIIATAVTDGSKGPTNGLDVRMKSESISVDQNLYQALNPPSKMAWLSFAPGGKARIDYHLYGNQNDKLVYQLDMYPLSASACYKEFAYPLDKIVGHIMLRPGYVELIDVVGSNHSGKIIGNGSISGLGSSDMDVNLEFLCSDVKIDETLVDLLPEEIGDKIEMFEFTDAFADMTVKVSSKKDALDYSVKAKAKASSMTFLPVKLTFADADVNIDFLDNRLNIESFNGLLNKQPVAVEGIVDIGIDDSMNYDIKFVSKSSHIEELITVFDSDTSEGFDISGAVDVEGRLKGDQDAAGYELILLCHDAGINLDGDAMKLEHSSGRIEVNSLEVKYDLQGQLVGSSCIVVSDGVLDATEPYNGNLSIELQNIKPTDSFMPDDIGISGDGNLNINFPNSRLNEGVLVCDKAVLSFEDIDFEGDVLNDATGCIECGIELSRNGGVAIPAGTLNIETIDVFDRKVERVVSTFQFDPIGGLIINEGLTAKVCDGEMSGSFKFIPKKGEGNYDIAFDFIDIDADKLLNSGSEDILKSQFDLDGRMSGQLYLKGILDDESSRVGRFTFDVDNVMVADKTITDKVLDAMLARSSAHTVQQLKVDAYLRRSTIFVEEVSISLPLMILRGGGEIGIDSKEISLQLSAYGTSMSNDGIFSGLSFLRAIGKSIAKVDITGDVTDPKIEVTTFGLIKK